MYNSIQLVWCIFPDYFWEEKKLKEAIQGNQIKSINRESASEQVYQQMKHFIDTQVWAPGYRIPSENKLAEEFGVSRMTIRSATQKLQALGLLNVRSGSGSYVEYPSLASYIGKEASGITAKALEEVYELRYYLEQAAVEFAIKNASDKDISVLKGILDRLVDAAINSPEDFRKHDIDFHRYIYVLSGNQLLLTMFNMIEPLFISQMDKFDSNIPSEELVQGRIDFHARMYNGIASKDIDLCFRQLYWYRDVSEASKMGRADIHIP